MEEARKIEEEYDEKLRMEREKEEEDEMERGRSERVKAREVMKELRAQRAIERDLRPDHLKHKVCNQKTYFAASIPSIILAAWVIQDIVI